MAKEKFVRSKPHVNVGTIGHIDHGKTTLTASLVKVQSKKGLAKEIKYADIAKGGIVRDETKTVTIAVSHVEYETATRHYAHVDCPGHADYIKNMITGARRWTARSCRVRARLGDAADGEHVLLAKQVGLNHVVVALNKCDAVEDKDMLELVEMEVRELLTKYKFDGDAAKVVQVAALPALNGVPEWEKSIENLLAALDSEIPEPTREVDKPFLMAVEDVFSIKGRGTVATGRIERGIVKVNDEIEIIGFDKLTKTVVTGVEMFRKQMRCQPAPTWSACCLHRKKSSSADSVGRLQHQAARSSRGGLLLKRKMAAVTRVLTNYPPQFYVRTTDVTAGQLPEGSRCYAGATSPSRRAESRPSARSADSFRDPQGGRPSARRRLPRSSSEDY